MKVYDAIMLAADHIERNPGQFLFAANGTPEPCGRGCALGWISYFEGTHVVGNEETDWFVPFCRDVLRVPDGQRNSAGVFFDRMLAFGGDRWMLDARVCAASLRKYAEKYHSEEKTQNQIPTWDTIHKITGYRPKELVRV